MLASMTSANPKIANYKFTTINPNLGVASYDDKEVTLADIPGLIEGCLLYTSPSPRDQRGSRMPSSA